MFPAWIGDELPNIVEWIEQSHARPDQVGAVPRD